MVQSPSSPQVELSITLSKVFREERSLENERASSERSSQKGFPIDNYAHQTLADNTQMLLHPGQPSKLDVQIKNNSTEPITLCLELGGQFPEAWFLSKEITGVITGETTGEITAARPSESWQSAETGPLKLTSPSFELSPQESEYFPLDFAPEAHFFEQEQALQHESTLNLRYKSQLLIFQLPTPAANSNTVQPDTPRQLVGYHAFEMFVRPSQVYLNFLPEIYQQSDFLGRFLSLCEQTLEPSFDMADMFWAYLDPLTAPKPMVQMLSHWVGWPMNPHWTLRQQRKLIRHAASIYRWRGTRRGLRECLHLFTELPLESSAIQIHDATEAGLVLNEQMPLGDQPCLGGGVPYHFSVVLCPQTADQADHLNTIEEEQLHSLIEQEKPAFCTYDLRIEPFTEPPESTPTDAKSIGNESTGNSTKE